MRSRDLPEGATVYENERFAIPEEWTRDGDRYVRITPPWTMTVVNNGSHNDWVFQVEGASVGIVRTGDASSRLAAMRKAELAVRNMSRG